MSLSSTFHDSYLKFKQFEDKNIMLFLCDFFSILKLLCGDFRELTLL